MGILNKIAPNNPESDNNTSIFLGFLLFIFGIIAVFTEPVKLIFDEFTFPGYGSVPLIIASVFGWFLLINGLINKYKWESSKHVSFLDEIPIGLFNSRRSKLVGFVSVFIMVFLISIYAITRPSVEDLLVSHKWFVNEIQYNDDLYETGITNAKTGIKLSINFEAIEFNNNGSMKLPRIESSYITGNWKIKNDSLSIYNVSDLGEIYEGVYTIDFKNNQIKLTSSNTSIVGKNLFAH